MTDYRVYYFDGSSHIGRGEWIEARSDGEAVALVRAKKLAVRSEVWQRDRLVARIAAVEKPST